jgi:hypothetical protein
MNNLFSSILENIKQNYKEKADNTTDIAFRIEKIIGIAIPVQSIKVTQGTLYLNISPTIKSAIASHKTEILEALADFNIDTIR